MKKLHRFLPILLGAAILLTGCGSSSTEGLYNEKGENVGTPSLVNINGTDIPYSMFRYFYLNLKLQADNGADSYWNGNEEAEAELLASTMSYLTRNAAIDKLAADNGISLTDEEKAASDKELAAMAEYYGGEDKFNEALVASSLNYEDYKEIFNRGKLETKLLRALYGDRIEKQVSENYVTAKHILIKVEEGATDTTEQLTKAEDILKQLEAGGDFDTLMKANSEDPGLTTNPNGYTFTKGEMLEEFQDAAYSLKENEVSGIVKTTAGYHIIKRLAIDWDTVYSNLSDYMPADVYDDYTKALSAIEDTLSITYADEYKLVSPTKVK